MRLPPQLEPYTHPRGSLRRKTAGARGEGRAPAQTKEGGSRPVKGNGSRTTELKGYRMNLTEAPTYTPAVGDRIRISFTSTVTEADQWALMLTGGWVSHSLNPTIELLEAGAGLPFTFTSPAHLRSKATGEVISLASDWYLSGGDIHHYGRGDNMRRDQFTSDQFEVVR